MLIVWLHLLQWSFVSICQASLVMYLLIKFIILSGKQTTYIIGDFQTMSMLQKGIKFDNRENIFQVQREQNCPVRPLKVVINLTNSQRKMSKLHNTLQEINES